MEFNSALWYFVILFAERCQEFSPGKGKVGKGFKVQGLELEVQGSRFKVQSSGFGVETRQVSYF